MIRSDAKVHIRAGTISVPRGIKITIGGGTGAHPGRCTSMRPMDLLVHSH